MPISEIEPTNQTYPISKIQGLQASLQALQDALNAKASISHTHAIAVITGLQDALNAKAPLSHTQAISTIEGLLDALNAKSSLNHTHIAESWQSLTLASGWSTYSAATPNAQCRKFFHLIEVKGTIKKATAVVSNETILTLPTGYRPAETRYFPTWSSNGYARVQVDADGSCKIQISGSNAVVGLDFIFGLL